MNRTFRLALLGGLAGLLTWLVSEPFARTAANHGVQAGHSMFSVGSFYGWFAHATLGAIIVGILAFSVSLERMRFAKALLWGLAGLALGGFLGWLSDSQSDLLCIRLLRASAIPDAMAGLIWSFAVALSLALGLALCTQPTLSRFARIMAGGLAAAVAAYFARIALAPLGVILSLAQGGRGGWQPYDPSRLADHATMGIILGLCVGLGETLLTSATLRLILGRNEGRDFPLGGLSRIGSAEGIEVPLFGSPDVAPVHAQIWRQDGRWILSDMGAPAGTRVNGHPVTQTFLAGGETIEIGPFRLAFSLKGQVPTYRHEPFHVPVAIPAPEHLPLTVHRLVDPFGVVTDLPEGDTTLGRDATSPVRLSHDGRVSRLHAKVVVIGAIATLEDLGSRNGTSLNGQPIRYRMPLNDGDTFRLGGTDLTYRVGTAI